MASYPGLSKKPLFRQKIEDFLCHLVGQALEAQRRKNMKFVDETIHEAVTRSLRLERRTNYLKALHYQNLN